MRLAIAVCILLLSSCVTEPVNTWQTRLWMLDQSGVIVADIRSNLVEEGRTNLDELGQLVLSKENIWQAREQGLKKDINERVKLFNVPHIEKVNFVNCPNYHSLFSVTERSVDVCRGEYVEMMRNGLGEAINFFYMQLVGDYILKTWSLPGDENTYYIDEFATVTLSVFGHDEDVDAAVTYFALVDIDEELSAIINEKLHRPMSIQRVRNIERFRENKDFYLNSWSRLLDRTKTGGILNKAIDEYRKGNW